MKKDENSKIMELHSNAMFTFGLWIGFGFLLIIVLEGLIRLNEYVPIKDFGSIFSMMLSVFLVFIAYTLIFFCYAAIKIFMKKETEIEL